jgi:fructosamine-3-kinase
VNCKADLAMAGLLTDFDDRFYQSWGHASAIVPGYTRRKVMQRQYLVQRHYDPLGAGCARHDG